MCLSHSWYKVDNEDGLHTRRCAACPFQCIQPPVRQVRICSPLPDEDAKHQRGQVTCHASPPVSVQDTQASRLELSAMVFLFMSGSSSSSAQRHWSQVGPSGWSGGCAGDAPPVRTHSQLCLLYSFVPRTMMMRAPGETCSSGKPPRSCPSYDKLTSSQKLILPGQ